METTCDEVLIKLFNNLAKLVPNPSDVSFYKLPQKDTFVEALNFDRTIKVGDYGLGQLSTKEEAAGKIRVFAMVDLWTQTACQSLHDYLMEVLKRLPNDGTFDQGLAFERANQKAILYKCAYGYDLSAATDRLPLSVQRDIISSLFGEGFAIA